MHPDGGSNGIDDVNTCLELLQVVSDRSLLVLSLDIELAYRVMDCLCRVLVTLEIITDLLNHF